MAVGCPYRTKRQAFCRQFRRNVNQIAGRAPVWTVRTRFLRWTFGGWLFEFLARFRIPETLPHDLSEIDSPARSRARGCREIDPSSEVPSGMEDVLDGTIASRTIMTGDRRPAIARSVGVSVSAASVIGALHQGPSRLGRGGFSGRRTGDVSVLPRNPLPRLVPEVGASSIGDGRLPWRSPR